VTPYLVVADVARLLQFVQAAFDAKVTERHDRPDGTVMHAEVRIGDSIVMMGGANDKKAPMPSMLYIYVQDTDAVYAKGIRAGATSLLAPMDQFYGDRNAGLLDPSGNQWWIATHVEDVAPDEMARRAAAHAQKQA
jgi:uncharacterized glyoxalase superfamily protein PhnB